MRRLPKSSRLRKFLAAALSRYALVEVWGELAMWGCFHARGPLQGGCRRIRETFTSTLGTGPKSFIAPAGPFGRMTGACRRRILATRRPEKVSGTVCG